MAGDVAPSPVAPLANAHAQAGYYRTRVGDMEITALNDGTTPVDTHAVLHGATTEQMDAALKRSFQSNPAEGSINAFLIDTGSRLVRVDVVHARGVSLPRLMPAS